MLPLCIERPSQIYSNILSLSKVITLFVMRFCCRKILRRGSGYLILGLGGEQRVLEYQYINLPATMTHFESIRPKSR